MRRIAIINQKGGVGKTTTTVNLGAALAQAGKRVLLVDLDPQSHLTLHLGIDPSTRPGGTYEALTQSTPLDQVRKQVAENLWMVGSHIDLAAAEIELVSVVGREVILRDLLDAHKANYDYVLMDCPPSLGVLTLNALAAASEIFIPLQPHYLALHGLSKLLETVSLVARRINPALRVTGVVVCMHEAGTRLASEVLEDVALFLHASETGSSPWAGARVFKTLIRRNIKLAECPSHGMTIFGYAPKSNGAEDYAALGDEVRTMTEAVECKPAVVAPATPAETPAVVARPSSVSLEETGTPAPARPARAAATAPAPETPPVSVTPPPPIAAAARAKAIPSNGRPRPGKNAGGPGPDAVRSSPDPGAPSVTQASKKAPTPSAEEGTAPAAAAAPTAPTTPPARAPTAGEDAPDAPRPTAPQEPSRRKPFSCSAGRAKRASKTEIVAAAAPMAKIEPEAAPPAALSLSQSA
jgi:chromosome partitioning protein